MNMDKRQVPDFEMINKVKQSLENLSIFQLHLADEDQILGIIQSFIKQALDWANLIRSSVEQVKGKIKKDFDDFSNSMIKFKEFLDDKIGNKISEKNPINIEERDLEEKKTISDYVKGITSSAFECYITMLTVLMCKRDDDVNQFRMYMIELFSSVGNSFDEKLLAGKLNYFKNDLIVEYTQEIELTDFYKKLKDHFYLFLSKLHKKYPYLLHPLLQNELYLSLNHLKTINSIQVDEFFKLYISSSQCFSQLMDKNTYYFKLEKALEQEYVFLKTLQNDFPKLIGYNAQIKITESSHLSSKNLIYYIGHNGLFQISKNDELLDFTKRSNKDCLVVVGKKDCKIFNFDIQLSYQSSEANDDIAALIFLNNNGLNIIDMSKKYAVQLYQTKTEINNEKVFVLGKKHYFWIEECKGIMFKNKKTTTIVFHCFDNCSATRDIDGYLFHLLPGQEIRIGSSFESNLTLRDDEIRENHAMIKLNLNGKLEMIDYSMGHTAFLLKTRRRIEKRKSSYLEQLKVFPQFSIHGYRFECTELTPISRR